MDKDALQLTIARIGVCLIWGLGFDFKTCILSFLSSLILSFHMSIGGQSKFRWILYLGLYILIQVKLFDQN